ncbi:MAG TPA: hypothetical protein VMS54_10135 [Vicinamibacterales bacterium]|nr:hypothetical protein [Vicinamibacterales bacterium]
MTRLRAIGLVGLGVLLGAAGMAGGQRLAAQGEQKAIAKAPAQRRFVFVGDMERVGPTSVQFYRDAKTDECYLTARGLDGGISVFTPVAKKSCDAK